MAVPFWASQLHTRPNLGKLKHRLQEVLELDEAVKGELQIECWLATNEPCITPSARSASRLPTPAFSTRHLRRQLPQHAAQHQSVNRRPGSAVRDTCGSVAETAKPQKPLKCGQHQRQKQLAPLASGPCTSSLSPHPQPRQQQTPGASNKPAGSSLQQSSGLTISPAPQRRQRGSAEHASLAEPPHSSRSNRATAHMAARHRHQVLVHRKHYSEASVDGFCSPASSEHQLAEHLLADSAGYQHSIAWGDPSMSTGSVHTNKQPHHGQVVACSMPRQPANVRGMALPQNIDSLLDEESALMCQDSQWLVEAEPAPLHAAMAPSGRAKAPGAAGSFVNTLEEISESLSSEWELCSSGSWPRSHDVPTDNHPGQIDSCWPLHPDQLPQHLDPCRDDTGRLTQQHDPPAHDLDPIAWNPSFLVQQHDQPAEHAYPFPQHGIRSTQQHAIPVRQSPLEPALPQGGQGNAAAAQHPSTDQGPKPSQSPPDCADNMSSSPDNSAQPAHRGHWRQKLQANRQSITQATVTLQDVNHRLLNLHTPSPKGNKRPSLFSQPPSPLATPASEPTGGDAAFSFSLPATPAAPASVPPFRTRQPAQASPAAGAQSAAQTSVSVDQCDIQPTAAHPSSYQVDTGDSTTSVSMDQCNMQPTAAHPSSCQVDIVDSTVNSDPVLQAERGWPGYPGQEAASAAPGPHAATHPSTATLPETTTIVHPSLQSLYREAEQRAALHAHQTQQVEQRTQQPSWQRDAQQAQHAIRNAKSEAQLSDAVEQLKKQMLVLQARMRGSAFADRKQAELQSQVNRLQTLLEGLRCDISSQSALILRHQLASLVSSAKHRIKLAADGDPAMEAAMQSRVGGWPQEQQKQSCQAATMQEATAAVVVPPVQAAASVPQAPAAGLGEAEAHAAQQGLRPPAEPVQADLLGSASIHQPSACAASLVAATHQAAPAGPAGTALADRAAAMPPDGGELRAVAATQHAAAAGSSSDVAAAIAPDGDVVRAPDPPMSAADPAPKPAAEAGGAAEYAAQCVSACVAAVAAAFAVAKEQAGRPHSPGCQVPCATGQQMPPSQQQQPGQPKDEAQQAQRIMSQPCTTAAHPAELDNYAERTPQRQFSTQHPSPDRPHLTMTLPQVNASPRHLVVQPPQQHPGQGSRASSSTFGPMHSGSHIHIWLEGQPPCPVSPGHRGSDAAACPSATQPVQAHLAGDGETCTAQAHVGAARLVSRQLQEAAPCSHLNERTGQPWPASDSGSFYSAWGEISRASSMSDQVHRTMLAGEAQRTSPPGPGCDQKHDRFYSTAEEACTGAADDMRRCGPDKATRQLSAAQRDRIYSASGVAGAACAAAEDALHCGQDEVLSTMVLPTQQDLSLRERMDCLCSRGKDACDPAQAPVAQSIPAGGGSPAGLSLSQELAASLRSMQLTVSALCTAGRDEGDLPQLQSRNARAVLASIQSGPGGQQASNLPHPHASAMHQPAPVKSPHWDVNRWSRRSVTSAWLQLCQTPKAHCPARHGRWLSRTSSGAALEVDDYGQHPWPCQPAAPEAADHAFAADPEPFFSSIYDRALQMGMISMASAAQHDRGSMHNSSRSPPCGQHSRRGQSRPSGHSLLPTSARRQGPCLSSESSSDSSNGWNTSDRSRSAPAAAARKLSQQKHLAAAKSMLHQSAAMRVDPGSSVGARSPSGGLLGRHLMGVRENLAKIRRRAPTAADRRHEAASQGRDTLSKVQQVAQQAQQLTQDLRAKLEYCPREPASA